MASSGRAPGPAGWRAAAPASVSTVTGRLFLNMFNICPRLTTLVVEHVQEGRPHGHQGLDVRDLPRGQRRPDHLGGSSTVPQRAGLPGGGVRRGTARPSGQQSPGGRLLSAQPRLRHGGDEAPRPGGIDQPGHGGVVSQDRLGAAGARRAALLQRLRTRPLPPEPTPPARHPPPARPDRSTPHAAHPTRGARWSARTRPDRTPTGAYPAGPQPAGPQPGGPQPGTGPTSNPPTR